MNNPMMGMNNPMMGMGMNNPMMGMNNGMTDDTSSRIKSIIEPYEKKIKDLEEQIRQKDFEIAVLKEKLNKSVNNNIQPMNPFPPQMGMGMGMGMGFAPPMMNMSMNFNNEEAINKNKEIIQIIFRLSGNNLPTDLPIMQRCFIDDEFGFVQKKVLKKLNIRGNVDDLRFIFNAKKAIPSLTVSELGITNNSNIFIVIPVSKNVELSLKEEEYSKDKITVIFKTTQGSKITMYLDPNMSIGLAIQKYLIRVDNKELINNHENNLAFLYNAMRYRPNDTISLKSLFQGNQGTILVNDAKVLIGA